jgi:NADH-quinone oxidoreductase subunit M
MFGEVTNPDVAKMKDLESREWLYFVPLAALVLWLGIHPVSMTQSLSPSVKHLLTQATPVAEAKPAATPAPEVKPAPKAEPVQKPKVPPKKVTPPPATHAEDDALPPEELPTPATTQEQE